MEPFLLDQSRAIREAAGCFERSDRGRIAVVGADRLAYLHAMLTNDIASLRPGKGCYGAYLTPQGRMIADMRVLELGDLTLLAVEAGATAVVLEKLEQFIFSEDVHLTDLTPQLAAIGVYGPRAAKEIAAVLAPGPGVEAIAGLAEYDSLRGSFDGGSAVVAGDRDLGVPGFEVYIDRARAPRFVAALREAGVPEVSAEAAEVLRIEAGRPRFGVDMDEATIPLEAGIERRAISFTKGCYPGQEVITRVLHRGHGRVARKLVGLVVDEADVPARGDRVLAGDKDAGNVTSATVSPSLGRPIALAYVHRDLTGPGTAVAIDRAGRRLSARVADLPFVRDVRPSGGNDG